MTNIFFAFAVFAEAEKVYRFSTLILAIPVVVTIIALAVGVLALVKFRNVKVGVAGIFAALLAGGIFAPSMYADAIKINSERIAHQKGFWFAPTVTEIRFAEVDFIRLRREVTDKGLTNTIWEVTDKNGARRDVDVGDLWDGNADEIIAFMQQHKVKFKNPAL